MVNRSKRSPAGWAQVDDMVRRWMQQRIELTNDYENIVTPGDGGYEATGKLAARLNRFCQTLVDYVSAGHFEVYNELIGEAREFNDGTMAMAVDLCHAIENSTDMALEFNEKYEDLSNATHRFSFLPRDLVELGSMLNLRFELEDSLIRTVHEVHRPMVA